MSTGEATGEAQGDARCEAVGRSLDRASLYL
jgi:hypothetical protein